jgi:predicted MFS family arabinose efflux permease
VWGGYSVGVPLLVTSIPGPDAAQFATVSAGYAAATLLGSALIAVRPPQKGLIIAAVTGWVVVGGAFVAMGLGGNMPIMVTGAVLMGLTVPPANVTTTIQLAAATEGRQRTAALLAQASVVNGSSAAGLIATGFAITVIGPRATLTVGGAAVLVGAALTFMRGGRRGRQAAGCGWIVPSQGTIQPQQVSAPDPVSLRSRASDG